MNKKLTTSAVAAILTVLAPTAVQAQELEEKPIESLKKMCGHQMFSLPVSSTYSNPNKLSLFNKDDKGLKELKLGFDDEVANEKSDYANSSVDNSTEDMIFYKKYYSAVKERQEIYRKINNLTDLLKAIDFTSEQGRRLAMKTVEEEKTKILTMCDQNFVLEQEFMLKSQSELYFIGLDMVLTSITENSNKSRIDWLNQNYLNENTIRSIK